MTRAYLAFTAKGLALAEKLAAEYPGSVARCGHEPGQPGLADWTAWQFAHSDALIFGGAVGICSPWFVGGGGTPPPSISAGSGYTPYACYVTFPHYYDTTIPPFCPQNAKK